MQRILDEVIDKLGLPGLKNLVYELSGHHNNYVVAESYGLTIWQVSNLSNCLPQVCRFMFEEERKQRTKLIKEHSNVFELKKSA